MQTVDDPKNFGGYASSRTIALEKNTNYPHIVYGGDHLYHAYFDGSAWQIETVDSAPAVGEDASIAVDSDRKVHISYYDSTNRHLRYATNTSGSWVSTATGPAEDTAQFTSIALDSNGKVHISYFNVTNDALIYATNAAGSWAKTIVDFIGDVGWFTSIALDSNDRVHISYYDRSNEALKYATNVSGSWIATTLDSTGVGLSTSIALDSNDKVHISYYDQTNGALKYTTNASDAWITTTVDGYGFASSIALDSNNKVHISYLRNLYEIGYATNESGSWVLTTIDNVQFNWLTSLALDSNDKAHISYLSAQTRFYDLKYATNESGAWITTIVDHGGDAGGTTSIAIDSNDKAYISYFGATTEDPNQYLKLATNSDGSWIKTTVDSAGDAGTFASIAMDSNNKPHISYSEVFDAGFGFLSLDLKYATNESGPWVTSTIDSAGEVGWYPSIAIDSNNKAHISYCEGFLNYAYEYWTYRLKYATNESGSWVATTIDEAGYVGSSTSIAMDSNNKAHISYYDIDNGCLKYLTNASGSWVTSTIDCAGDVGWDPSIAIDSNNYVHIAYVDVTNEDLKYATNASGSWVTATIDNAGDVGWEPSIAVDSNNKVHISYSDAYKYDLKYASNASGSWVTSTIDSDGNVGWGPSIGVDSKNTAHISYIDVTSGAVKYATTCGVFLTDVPQDYWAESYIRTVYCDGLSIGCTQNPVNYCPSNNVTRQAMAAFIIRALYGENFTYPATPYFTDVPDTHQFFKYIQKMKELGITTGCTATEFCPGNNVTRQAMAAFIIRAKFGETFAYSPYPSFIDVPNGNQFFKYIQKLKDERITTGCYSQEIYCPGDNVTRASMAAFLARAFLGMP